MTNKLSKQLLTAYLETDYIIDDSIGLWQININDTDRSLSKYLHTFDKPCAAFITAHNPMSKRLSEKENKKRHQQLLSLLKQQGVNALNGYGIGATGDWPKEDSVFLTNVDQAQASQIAKKFNQAAYVWVNEKGEVTLITYDKY